MNILVVTLSNFGDVIMTTPVIMALVCKYPEARITVVVGPRASVAADAAGNLVMHLSGKRAPA